MIELGILVLHYVTVNSIPELDEDILFISSAQDNVLDIVSIK